MGEIWLKSRSCALGYWGQKERSEEDFNAVLNMGIKEEGDEIGIKEEMKMKMKMKEGGYLRTGDLGFRHFGELFVCGRVKDLIIVRGRNHYPQDIERTCESLTIYPLSGGVHSITDVCTNRGTYKLFLYDVVHRK